MFTNLDDALDHIYSFINLEQKNDTQKKKSNAYNLDNITNAVKKLDIDLTHYKFIHIAGTKGKGSITHFISSLLTLENIKNASFTSPHLIKVNERFKLNDTEISDKELLSLINFISNKLTDLSLTLTTFEFFFIIFLYFGINNNAEYFIVETGLGGRLDCTNIITPIVSCISTIGYDHTEILGETLQEITGEKCGIIKKNIPVVVNKQLYPDVYKYIEFYAQGQTSELYKYNSIIKINSITPTEQGQTINFKINDINIIKRVNFFGEHQIYNLITALTTIHTFNKEILDNFLKTDFAITTPISRISLIDKKRPIITDVAHNYESALMLTNTLQKHFPGKKWTLLLGLSIERNPIDFVKPLVPILEKIIITQIEFKNNNPQMIYDSLIKHYKMDIEIIENFSEAYKKVNTLTGPLLVAGSFYLTGPFLNRVC